MCNLHLCSNTTLLNYARYRSGTDTAINLHPKTLRHCLQSFINFVNKDTQAHCYDTGEIYI